MVPNVNISKLFFSQSFSSDIGNVKSNSGKSLSDNSFKSVFDSVVSNSASAKKVSTQTKNDKNDSDIKNDSNTFRDIRSNQTTICQKNPVDKASQTGNIDDVNDLNEDKEQDDDNSNSNDNIINLLAQMLGMQPNELIQLAKDLGFSQQDLTQNLNLFMDKLGNALKLNASQQEMLKTISEEIQSALNIGTDNDTIGSNSQGQIASDGFAETNSKALDLSKISDEVKTKLDDLIQNAQVDTDYISTQVKNALAAMKSKTQTTVDTTVEKTDNDGQDEIPVTDEKDNSKKVEENHEKSHKSKHEKYAEDHVTASESTDSSVKTTTETSNVPLQTAGSNNGQTVTQDQQSFFAIGNVKPGIVNNQTPVEKTQFSMPLPVKSSEVVDQVVEHAKVILGQDKSEMVIQLKPDHLGKLELKVVTEQGIVEAKFIAENQKVKEIIETNMQLLKDSLQKQGISIDAVSVHVGSNNSEGYQKQSTYSNNKKHGSDERYNFAESGVAATEVSALESLPERLAQYSSETESKINLKA